MKKHYLVNFMSFGVHLGLIKQLIVFSACLALNIYLRHGEHYFLMIIITLLIKLL